MRKNQPKKQIKDIAALKKRLKEKCLNDQGEIDPLSAFQTFFISHENAIQRPTRTMDYLAENLRLLWNPKYGQSLDKIFGLEKKQHVKKDSTPFGKIVIMARNSELAFAMLRHIRLGLGVEESAKKVSGIYAKMINDYDVLQGISIPTANTLIKIHHQLKRYNSPKWVKMADEENKKDGFKVIIPITKTKPRRESYP